MRSNKLNLFATLFVVLIIALSVGIRSSMADSAAEINREVNAALKKLYQNTPEAKKLSKEAKGILVFPDVVKAGLIVGGQYGEGALRDKKGKSIGYYNTVAASYGLQAGAQSFGYALFFSV